MVKKIVISSEHAPKPIGPYSVAIRAGDLIFTAGQIGIDPKTSEVVSGGIETETRQVLTNIRNILETANSSMDLVIKTTVFLRDMSEFGKMNSIYAEFFTENFPARSTIQVAALPKGAAVEIETVAAVKE
jgi:2-iminobutanoate/2-iminopropanoate deaminase